MMKLYSYLTHCLLYGSCLWLLAGCIQREESTETTGPAELALTFIEDVVINEGELVPEDFLVLPVSSSNSEGKAQIYMGERQTIVEVFSSDGKIEGVGRLSELTYPENEKIAQIRPFWKDQDDRFYFLDVSQDSPVVRIGRIQGI